MSTTEELDCTQVDFVTYDGAGRITQTGKMPRYMVALQNTAEHSAVEGSGHWDMHHVKDGAIVPRPANPTVLTGNVLTNVPKDAVLDIDGAQYETGDESTVDLHFPHAGTYTVKVSAFPYTDVSFVVTQ